MLHDVRISPAPTIMGHPAWGEKEWAQLPLRSESCWVRHSPRTRCAPLPLVGRGIAYALEETSQVHTRCYRVDSPSTGGVGWRDSRRLFVGCRTPGRSSPARLVGLFRLLRRHCPGPLGHGHVGVQGGLCGWPACSSGAQPRSFAGLPPAGPRRSAAFRRSCGFAFLVCSSLCFRFSCLSLCLLLCLLAPLCSFLLLCSGSLLCFSQLLAPCLFVAALSLLFFSLRAVRSRSDAACFGSAGRSASLVAVARRSRCARGRACPRFSLSLRRALFALLFSARSSLVPSLSSPPLLSCLLALFFSPFSRRALFSLFLAALFFFLSLLSECISGFSLLAVTRTLCVDHLAVGVFLFHHMR